MTGFRHWTPFIQGDAIMRITRGEIIPMPGPVDEGLDGEIAATGAAVKELREACAWLHGDEAPMGDTPALPCVAESALRTDLLV